MANIASQKKRILRSERERVENRRLTSAVKTHFRRLEQAASGGRRRRRSRASTARWSRGSTRRSSGARSTPQRRPQEGARRAASSRGASGLARPTSPAGRPRAAPGSAPAPRRSRSRPRHQTSRSASAHRSPRAARPARRRAEPGDQLLRRVGVHAERRPRPASAGDPALQLRARPGGPCAAARRARRRAPVTLSPCETRRSAELQGAARVALEHRVGERPGGRLGGVGDHRLEVALAHLPVGPGPEREPVELVARAGPGSAPSARSEAGGGGIEPEAAACGPRRPAGAATRAPSARRNSPHLAAARPLTASAEPARRRLAAGDQDDRQLGRHGRQRRGDLALLRLASSARRRRPAGSGATAVSDIAGIAATRPRRPGAPWPGAGLEDLERRRAPLALRARAQARPGRRRSCRRRCRRSGRRA